MPRPLLAAVIVAVGLPVASQASVSPTRRAAVNPCGRIGLSVSQNALVQRRARASIPADVRRLATAGGFYVCIAVPQQGHTFAAAFHVPIPNVGSRADVRWVMQVASPSVAAASVAAIRRDPRRFLTTFGIDTRTHVEGARSLRAWVIVTMSQIRTG